MDGIGAIRPMPIRAGMARSGGLLTFAGSCGNGKIAPIPGPPSYPPKQESQVLSRRRRMAPRPARPVPSSASDAGSGTAGPICTVKLSEDHMYT